MYPHFTIAPNKHPSRFYAVPLIGFLVKMIILIPVIIEGFFLWIAFVVLWIINSFVILFTGNYWDTAYNFFPGFMRFGIKITSFIYGLTDKYPGFNLQDDGLFELTIAKPAKPNRWFAFPLLGLLARFILLIPYYVFTHVMGNGSFVAMIISWFPVLVNGKFPESTYEFEQDTIRVSMAGLCYLTGLSDKYPSFHISMNHQTIKILLLIAGAILLVNNGRGFFFHPGYQGRMNYHYQYYQQYKNYPTSAPASGTY